MLGLVFTLLGAIENGYAQFEAGQTVTVPPILTYLFGKRVKIDITMSPAV